MELSRPDLATTGSRRHAIAQFLQQPSPSDPPIELLASLEFQEPSWAHSLLILLTPFGTSIAFLALENSNKPVEPVNSGFK